MRYLRLNLWMAALATSLALLIGFASRDLARADGETNAASDANVEQGAGGTSPSDADQTQEESPSTNGLPQEIMELLQPPSQTAVTPPTPPAPPRQSAPAQPPPNLVVSTTTPPSQPLRT
ncbi:MAG: hypothetical protein ABSH14_06885, partial [Verrucomicrobiia bacterium]